MTHATALDPTKPNTPPHDYCTEQVVDGLTSGVWYRWVDTDHAERVVREGIGSRRGEPGYDEAFRLGSSLWRQVDGPDVWPHWVSRDPSRWEGFSNDGVGDILLAIQADGLRIAPDYNMVCDDWHDDMLRDGFVQLRDYNTRAEPVIATYTLDDLRTDRVIAHLLFDGDAACIIDDITPDRITVVRNADPIHVRV